MDVLVVNAGSTSTKLRLVDADGQIVGRHDLEPDGDPERAIDQVTSGRPPAGVGHRIVHGGPVFTEAVVIDDQVRTRLEGLNDLAPLHNPPALRWVDALRDRLPAVPHTASFDTAFHAHLPLAASHYALPNDWVRRWSLRKYGFHGLSCQWSRDRAATLLQRPFEALRMVICHLGGGASVTGVRAGRPVDTTMGFTPAAGLIMATRSGDVDPALVAWLCQQGIGAEVMAEALERRSGLLAMTEGQTGDLRTLVDRSDGDDVAARAVEAYVHRLVEKVGGQAAVMGGLDALVFTGGVGEHLASVRAAVCERLRWAGVQLDLDRNGGVGQADELVSRSSAPVAVLVVHAQEELVIAAEHRRTLRLAAG